MKRFFKYSLVAVAGILALASCKKEEVYNTSVTRELSMTLDGEPWNIYYGTSNKPLFIYDANGKFYGNYSTGYRFSMPDGSYKVFATTQADLLTPPAALDDEYIPQDSTAKQTFAISDPVDYAAGNPMSLELKTRTGKLRLRALDTKADKSYSIIRAIINTPVTAYKVSTATVVADGEGLSLPFCKETAGGGVGYTEELNLIASADHKVNVLIEYLDADSNVVNTKPFADGFTILPNELTEVSFELNNPDEAVIVSYDIMMGSLDWRENTIYPSVKVNVPDGFTYVSPDMDLTQTIKEQLADESVDEIKLFLKAGSAYSIADKTLEGINKPFVLMGQTPGYGQTLASVSLVNITMEGDLSEIRFENLELKPQKDRLFNLRNQKFHIGEIAFVNCTTTGWNGSIWAQTAAADNEQIVDKIKMAGCCMTNMTVSTALWNITNRRVAPVYNIEFTDNLFHGRNFGTRNVFITGLDKTPGTMNIVIEGNTFIDTRGTNFTYFDINCAAASSSTLTVRNNMVTGSKSGMGTWFSLGTVGTVQASGNTRSAGYEMKAYGIDAPAESAKTYNDILSQFNL